ncbi:hypothetical protein K402DRAFT_408089 [Aulographum hederae CBS 113979]|uniref:DH domain-containing protein n=1 Tax=Aulographum hederae CBS 113979 TaxID=1176131 RepID=A0A6G1GM17_9PEZI|nr:hypothetical protein K402DRAFT_408089 [Aulographum hederae CBS 113979]
MSERQLSSLSYDGHHPHDATNHNSFDDTSPDAFYRTSQPPHEPLTSPFYIPEDVDTMPTRGRPTAGDGAPAASPQRAPATTRNVTGSRSISNPIQSSRSTPVLSSSSNLVKQRRQHFEDKLRQDAPRNPQPEGSTRRYYRHQPSNAPAKANGVDMRNPRKIEPLKQHEFGSTQHKGMSGYANATARPVAGKKAEVPARLLFGEVVNGSDAAGFGIGSTAQSEEPTGEGADMAQPDVGGQLLNPVAYSASAPAVRSNRSASLGNPERTDRDHSQPSVTTSGDRLSPLHATGAADSFHARSSSDEVSGSRKSSTSTSGSGAAFSKDSARRKLFTPPPTLTATRYTSPRSPTSKPSKISVSKPPPATTSPHPLKSSRPRIPVADASTSASRAKMQDRVAKEPPTRRSRSRAMKAGEGESTGLKDTLPRTTYKRNPRQDPSRQSADSQSTSASQEEETPSVNGRSSQESQAGPDETPKLSLDVNNLERSKHLNHIKSLNFSEVDESPILGRPSFKSVTPGAEKNGKQNLHTEEMEQTESALTSEGACRSDTPHLNSESPSPNNAIHTLDSVLPQTTYTPFRQSEQLDNETDIDDTGTLQFMLGTTPRIPAPGALWHNSTFEPASGNVSAPDDAGTDFAFDACSIAPSDSISIVNASRSRSPPPPVPNLPSNLTSNLPKMANSLNSTSNLPPNFPLHNSLNRPQYTLDSEARSVINHILNHYHTKSVTPEMTHGFKQQIGAISPELAQSEAWQDQNSARALLEDILEMRDELRTPVNTQSESTGSLSTGKKRYHYSDSTPSDAGPGTAVIYRSSQDIPVMRGLDYGSTRDDASDSFKPPPPPKDTNYPTSPGMYLTSSSSTPQRLELPDVGGGLGLMMDGASDEHGDPSWPAHSPPPVPHPPAPIYSPPPPPAMLAAPSHLRSPASPSVYSTRTAVKSESAIERLHGENIVRDFAVNGAPISSLQDQPKSADATAGMTSFSSSQIANGGGNAVNFHGPTENFNSTPTTVRNMKALVKRKDIMKELVETELKYNMDMKTLNALYRAPASSYMTRDEVSVLFGTSNLIEGLSDELLFSLKKAVAPVYRQKSRRGSQSTANSGETEPDLGPTEEKDRQTCVSEVFFKHLERLEQVYGAFMRQRSEANELSQRMQKQPLTREWLEETAKNVKELTNAWDLDSVLIKPTQRIMKYPLLLKELLQETPKDHPDYEGLKTIIGKLMDAVDRINAQMTKSEIVRKSAEADSRKKMAYRLVRPDKFRLQTGMANLPEDPEYTALAQKFGGHFLTLQIVMRDFEKYLEDLASTIQAYHTFVDQMMFYMGFDSYFTTPSTTESRAKWTRLSQAVRELGNRTFQDHEAAVRKCVISPINRLWELHGRTQVIMRSRKKRLPAFQAWLEATEKSTAGGRSRTDQKERLKWTKEAMKLKVTAEEYKANTELLKTELPQLYRLGKKMVESCLHNFVVLQAEWQTAWKTKLRNLDENPRQSTGDFGTDIGNIAAEFSADFNFVDQELTHSTLFSLLSRGSSKNPYSPFSGSYTTKQTSFTESRRGNSIQSEPNDYGVSSIKRHSGNFTHSPIGVDDPSIYNRVRAATASSSRRQTPRTSSSNFFAMSSDVSRPSTSSERLDGNFNRDSLGVVPDNTRPNSGSSHFIEPRNSNGHRPGSYVFSSAVPLDLGVPPPSTGEGVVNAAVQTEADNTHLSVMFLAASLFEFNIDASRHEAGYPYLQYQPGEVFDVIAQKGELWLARNQDDPSGTIGWIWEKHFARILPDES